MLEERSVHVEEHQIKVHSGQLTYLDRYQSRCVRRAMSYLTPAATELKETTKTKQDKNGSAPTRSHPQVQPDLFLVESFTYRSSIILLFSIYISVEPCSSSSSFYELNLEKVHHSEIGTAPTLQSGKMQCTFRFCQ